MRAMLLVVLLLYSNIATAKDFGIKGKTFEITEVNMLEYIQMKLKELEADGTLAAKQQEMAEHTKKIVNRPKAVKGITHTQEYKKRYYDPTHIFTEDAIDHEGHIIYTKGESYNPLDIAPLPEVLIFIDGDDNKQLEYALKENQKQLSKIILTKGSIGDLMRKHKIRLYFDQMGILTTKLGIDKVPTTVRQKGNKLLLEEVFIGEGGDDD